MHNYLSPQQIAPENQNLTGKFRNTTQQDLQLRWMTAGRLFRHSRLKFCLLFIAFSRIPITMILAFGTLFGETTLDPE
jgi:hypothetical protein